jgi:hypothetical protein
MRRLILRCSFLLLLLPAGLMAQGVTTSSLTGVVLDETGEPLAGATVLVVHVPSGTEHGTATRLDGTFRISNMRAGGPYTLTFSFVGYNRQVIEDVHLRLGDTYYQRVSLTPGDVELDEVVVTARLDRVFNYERTGAATSITDEQIALAGSVAEPGHSRADRRALAYHRAVAKRLTRKMIDEAVHRVWKWRAENKLDPRYADEWESVLQRPVADVRRTITSDSAHARDLRQNSPFAGMLSEPERRRILELTR